MDKRIRKLQRAQNTGAKLAMQEALDQLVAQNEGNELLASTAKLYATYCGEQAIYYNTINAAQEACRRDCAEKQSRRSKGYKEKKRKRKEEENKQEKESNVPVFDVSDSEEVFDVSDSEDEEEYDFPESLNAAHQIMAEVYYRAGILSSP